MKPFRIWTRICNLPFSWTSCSSNTKFVIDSSAVLLTFLLGISACISMSFFLNLKHLLLSKSSVWSEPLGSASRGLIFKSYCMCTKQSHPIDSLHLWLSYTFSHTMWDTHPICKYFQLFFLSLFFFFFMNVSAKREELVKTCIKRIRTQWLCHLTDHILSLP